ncbi:MAG: class I SAM-dependent methyltransferase [Bacteroidales bacterium]|nr:class I SAM-dependent methyltransferase [Bacteroidales bacterium]
MNKKYRVNRDYIPNVWDIFFNPVFIARYFLFRKLKKNFPFLKGNVMDFGCGISPYRPYISCNKYYRVDFEVTFQFEDDRKDEIIFYNGNEVPFANNSLDGILATEVLEHVPEVELIIKEFYRILKPGGYVLISIPFAWGEHNIPYDFRRLTSFGLRYIFEKNGFKVLQLEKTSNTIHTITQLITSEIRHQRLPGIPFIKPFFNFLFIFPLQFLGFLIGYLIPDRRKVLPLNLVLLAVKENN